MENLIEQQELATMHGERVQHRDIVDIEPEPVSFRGFAMLFWRNRRKLVLIGFLGVLFGLAITIPASNEYESTAQLMPPEAQAFSGAAMIAPMAGSQASSLLASVSDGDDYLSGKTLAGTVIGILGSRTVLDDIVDRFNLQTAYKLKYKEDARKTLINSTELSVDKKSGIISISVTDDDPRRARDIAQAYIDELAKLVSSLNTSSAHRERQFLEVRLNSLKSDLDSDSKTLSDFASHNATMDPVKQGDAAVEAAEKLQGDLITAQSELSGLSAEYTDDNVRVRATRKRVNELQQQLSRLTNSKGSGASQGAGGSANGIPSVRELPLLGLTYTSLSRKIGLEESLYEALDKEYELAKVQEIEQIIPVKVLDPPQIPEKRLSKHRLRAMFLGMLIWLFIAISWIVARHLWKATDDEHPAKALVIALLRMKRLESQPAAVR